MRAIALCAALLAVLLALPAAAAENTGVARISVIAKGSVVLQRGDDKTQLAATVNTPVLPDDYVMTASGTQAELQLDGITMLRMGGDVQLRIANNDQTMRLVQLAQGTVVLAVLHAQSGTSEVDTPSVTLRAAVPGDYRIAVGADGTTTATARTGGAQIVTPQQTYDLAPGKTIVASGSAENPTVTSEAEIAYDALDSFSSSRDRTANAALNTNTYVPTNIAGYDDLNSYGRWIDVQGYGEVWSPYVDSNWAPYRNGSWVWEDGFGWTWIANEPWGWAPFHYGSWFQCDPYGWCWYPPGVASVPVWYPAYVGWFGFGDYWGITLGFDYWGWVPLGPWETYYPWYPGWGGWHSHPNPPITLGHVNPAPPRGTAPPRTAGPVPRGSAPPRGKVPPPRMHPRYGTGVETAYRNMERGATGVKGSDFRNGNFTRTVVVDPNRLKNVTSLRGALPMTPTGANLRFTTHAAPKAPVRVSPVFAAPRFATAPDIPGRTQFGAQRREMNQTLRSQSREAVPARPQAPPAADAWKTFERTRGNLTLPNEPQPRRYPGTTPVHLPSQPQPGHPHPPPPQPPPVTPPHPPSQSAPPVRPPSAPSRPPSGGGRPPSRPPA
jgi:hypothetical protein